MFSLKIKKKSSFKYSIKRKLVRKSLFIFLTQDFSFSQATDLMKLMMMSTVTCYVLECGDINTHSILSLFGTLELYPESFKMFARL